MASVYWRMWRRITESLDRWAIKAACASVVAKTGDHHEHEAEELLRQPDFFEASPEPPCDIRFADQKHFSFTSPLKTRWTSNNIVSGRFFRAGRDWRQRPVIILLHGWNSELSYQSQFPFLAWRLNRHRVNAAMFQLPFHGRRRPAAGENVSNFISHDLLTMVEATRQSLAEARALAAWLLNEGCPVVGVWGISLGAWLAGLLVCHDPCFRLSALMTPVPNVEAAIRELDFCAPVRVALENHYVDVSRLNLASLQPLMPPEQILIIQAQYDIFAPVELVDELWRCWHQPQIWRVAHGHISVLMSLPVMERTVRWLADNAYAVVRSDGSEPARTSVGAT